MKKYIVTVPQAEVPMEALLAYLHMDIDNDEIESIEAMRQEALAIARPIALYAPLKPETREGLVYLNGVCIEESFVYDKLSGCECVIPYVASCGRELGAWAGSFTDVFDQFTAEALKQLCLNAVMEKLLSAIKSQFFNAEQPISILNPGSLKEWPLSGQRPLFKLLGGVTEDTGVELTESLLMRPNKSVSGIIFQKDEHFVNCRLCPRIDCPNRRASYTDTSYTYSYTEG